MRVTILTGAEGTTTVEEALQLDADTKMLAFDMEGKDLGREGFSSIIQLAKSPEHVLLLDVMGKNKNHALIKQVKPILENPDILKIVHDCRMDSDALYHHFGISLAGIWDTSVATGVITNNYNKNLNDTLSMFGLQPNKHRHSNVYETRPAFWLERPLTAEMANWASGDLKLLFDLHDAQTKRAVGAEKPDKIQKMSLTRARCTRDASTRFGRIENVGRFMGKGGKNIRDTELVTFTSIYGFGGRDGKRFVIYYHPEPYGEKGGEKKSHLGFLEQRGVVFEEPI